ncbi:hypothetical protein GN958_ATG18219 [Phytophthora infestans]|uniref:Uncharacterized protein n=1 Tax=Phytophthora infestans TaxID=4787 RepID=A0A8S9U304_PHYIN|nr:hypothetical protein GN958_ATG18219 [Phytophthora infestans]
MASAPVSTCGTARTRAVENDEQTVESTDAPAGPTILIADDEVGEERNSAVRDPDDAAAGSVQLNTTELVVPSDDNAHLSVENALAKNRSAIMEASPEDAKTSENAANPRTSVNSDGIVITSYTNDGNKQPRSSNSSKGRSGDGNTNTASMDTSSKAAC